MTAAASGSRQQELNSLMYLSYGDGPHIADTRYSLLTAFHFLPPGTPGYRYILYTDDPGPFRDLGIDFRVFDGKQFQAWLGGSTYVHRCKISAVREQVHRSPGKTAFLDSDTYFLRSPRKLFERISPGHACMHVREGELGKSQEPVHRAVLDQACGLAFNSVNSQTRRLSAHTAIWNTGVIGLHSADAARLDDALRFCDELWACHPSRITEQIAVDLALEDMPISDAYDVVFHYWPQQLRDRFRKVTSAALEETSNQSVTEQSSRAYAGRPRPDAVTALKARAKYFLAKAGLPMTGLIRSA